LLSSIKEVLLTKFIVNSSSHLTILVFPTVFSYSNFSSSNFIFINILSFLILKHCIPNNFLYWELGIDGFICENEFQNHHNNFRSITLILVTKITYFPSRICYIIAFNFIV